MEDQQPLKQPLESDQPKDPTPQPLATPVIVAPPSDPLPDISLINSYQGVSAWAKYLRLLPLAIVVLLLVIGSSVALDRVSNSTHALATKIAASKAASSKATQKQAAPAPTSSNTAPSGTTPTSTPAGPAPTISLTNQDNGRALTIPVGAHLNVYLTGAVGYHWSIQARSSNPRLFSPDGPVVDGTDGSITEDRTATLLGTVTIGYTDNPNCYPTCTQEPPLNQWSAVVTVDQ